MSGLVDWLNETREFYWFVKKVRVDSVYSDDSRCVLTICVRVLVGPDGVPAIRARRAASPADRMTWRPRLVLEQLEADGNVSDGGNF